MTAAKNVREALLPCPWCGKEMVGEVVVIEGSTFRWRMVSGCCTDGPEVRHNTMTDDQAAAEVESRAKAIAAWNTRKVSATAAGDDTARLDWLDANPTMIFRSGKQHIRPLIDAAILQSIAAQHQGERSE